MKKKLLVLVSIGLLCSSTMFAPNNKKKRNKPKNQLQGAWANGAPKLRDNNQAATMPKAPVTTEQIDVAFGDCPSNKNMEHTDLEWNTVDNEKVIAVDQDSTPMQSSSSSEGSQDTLVEVATEDAQAAPAPDETSSWWKALIASTSFLGKGSEDEQEAQAAPAEVTEKNADEKTKEILNEIAELEELLPVTTSSKQHDKLKAQIEEKEKEIEALVESYEVPEKKHQHLPKKDGLLASAASLLLLKAKQDLREQEHKELKKQIDDETSKIDAIKLPKLTESEKIEFHTTRKDDAKNTNLLSGTPDASAKTKPSVVSYPGQFVKVHSIVMKSQKVKKGDSEVEVQVPIYKRASQANGLKKREENPKVAFKAVVQEIKARNTKTETNKYIQKAAAYQHHLKARQPFVEGVPLYKSLENRVLEQETTAAQIKRMSKNKKAQSMLSNFILAAVSNQHKRHLALNSTEGYGRVVIELDKITISKHPGREERKGELKVERNRTRKIKQALEKAADQTELTINKTEQALETTTQNLDSVLKQLKALHEQETVLNEQRDTQLKTLAYAKVDQELAKRNVANYNERRQPLLDAHKAVGGNSWFSR